MVCMKIKLDCQSWVGMQDNAVLITIITNNTKTSRSKSESSVFSQRMLHGSRDRISYNFFNYFIINLKSKSDPG